MSFLLVRDLGMNKLLCNSHLVLLLGLSKYDFCPGPILRESVLWENFPEIFLTTLVLRIKAAHSEGQRQDQSSKQPIVKDFNSLLGSPYLFILCWVLKVIWACFNHSIIYVNAVGLQQALTPLLPSQVSLVMLTWGTVHQIQRSCKIWTFGIVWSQAQDSIVTGKLFLLETVVHVLQDPGKLSCKNVTAILVLGDSNCLYGQKPTCPGGGSAWFMFMPRTHQDD